MDETGPVTAHGHGVEGDHHHPAEEGERVAVLLGYTMERLGAAHPEVEVIRLPSLNDDPDLLGLAAGWITPLVDDAASA